MGRGYICKNLGKNGRRGRRKKKNKLCCAAKDSGIEKWNEEGVKARQKQCKSGLNKRGYINGVGQKRVRNIGVNKSPTAPPGGHFVCIEVPRIKSEDWKQCFANTTAQHYNGVFGGHLSSRQRWKLLVHSQK